MRSLLWSLTISTVCFCICNKIRSVSLCSTSIFNILIRIQHPIMLSLRQRKIPVGGKIRRNAFGIIRPTHIHDDDLVNKTSYPARHSPRLTPSFLTIMHKLSKMTPCLRSTTGSAVSIPLSWRYPLRGCISVATPATYQLFHNCKAVS